MASTERILDAQMVDEETAEDPVRSELIDGQRLSLRPFAVTVANIDRDAANRL